MPIEKTFNPDFEYSFWFWKSKFNWILEMIAMVIEYEFTDGELEGMLLDLQHTNNEDGSKWSGGLHYGKNGTMYINMALDADDRDKVSISITTKQRFQSNLEFIDHLQCKYNGFY